MTHAAEPSSPPSERPSQRMAYGEVFTTEEPTRLVPPLPRQRRGSPAAQQTTAPEDPVPGGDTVALIAFTSGIMTGTLMPIEPQTAVTIGRSERCSIQIDDVSISRLHARLNRTGASVSLIDSGSTNGTFVNGQRVNGALSLRSGDSVRLGTRHGFRFLLGDEHEFRALTAVYESATRDGLTGLLNRRMFDQALEGELSFARRHGTGVALLLLDVDHFKNVNDTHGHAAGDSVLRAIGDQLREAVRAEDVAARVGGEEFGILVRDVSKTDAAAMARRLADHIGSERVLVGESAVQVTVSIGIATLDECDVPAGAEQLMGIADLRLYRAKLSRNCVVAQ